LIFDVSIEQRPLSTQLIPNFLENTDISLKEYSRNKVVEKYFVIKGENIE
jgi:hypothetical protein